MIQQEGERDHADPAVLRAREIIGISSQEMHTPCEATHLEHLPQRVAVEAALVVRAVERGHVHVEGRFADDPDGQLREQFVDADGGPGGSVCLERAAQLLHQACYVGQVHAQRGGGEGRAEAAAALMPLQRCAYDTDMSRMKTCRSEDITSGPVSRLNVLCRISLGAGLWKKPFPLTSFRTFFASVGSRMLSTFLFSARPCTIGPRRSIRRSISKEELLKVVHPNR